MTALILDDTAKHAGNRVMHCLVVGVSDYTHLPDPGVPPVQGSYGLQKLTAASKTAIEIARWLEAQKDKLIVPIATIRVCVAPTLQDTLDQTTATPHGATGATRAEVAAALHEWRKNQQPDDIALFYFAGHGVQRFRADMVLLCSDFNAPGDGTLSRTVELTNIYGGLNRTPVQADVARTQMYFIDACRERPKAFDKFEQLGIPDVFNVTTLQTRDDRHAPIFYATTPGTLAYADPGVATLFSKTLLRCLENEAATLDDATGEWQVTSKSLERALTNRFRALAGNTTEQEVDADHAINEFVISKLAAPPTCTIKFQVDPDEALPVTAIMVRDLNGGGDVQLPRPLQPHPFEQAFPGGYYQFTADIDPPQPPYVPRKIPRLIDPSRPGSVEIKLKVMP